MRRFSLASMGGSTATASTVFLVSEDFEGTGAPSGWTAGSGTPAPNFDYTTVPLDGAQSLYLASASQITATRPADFTNITEVWFYLMFRATNGTAPSAASQYVGLAPNGGGSVITWRISAGLKLLVGSVTTTATSIVLDTTYHVWGHYLQGTGANAVVDVGFSTNGVRPTSGGTFAQVTTDPGTVAIGRINLGTTGTSMGMDIIIDKLRVAATQIGDFGV